MAKRGRPRKTRVTKEQVKRIQEEQKLTSYARKKRIIPGPWTKIEPQIRVKAKLMPTKGVMNEILGAVAYGSYLQDRYGIEKGWYPIVINIHSKNMKKAIAAYGLDQYLAACERSLTEAKDYGTVIILEAGANSSDKESPEDRFISVKAKTNKKGIKGFRAIRKGVLTTL